MGRRSGGEEMWSSPGGFDQKRYLLPLSHSLLTNSSTGVRPSLRWRGPVAECNSNSKPQCGIAALPTQKQSLLGSK